MSIVSQAKDLQNFSDQMLIELGEQGNGRYPGYLQIAEVRRRADLEKRWHIEKAKADAANPPSIAEQGLEALSGIAGLDPSMGGGQPSQGMPDPGMGQMGGPPPGMDQMQGMGGPPPMMAYGGGLIPGYQQGGDIVIDPYTAAAGDTLFDEDEEGFMERMGRGAMSLGLGARDLEGLREQGALKTLGNAALLASMAIPGGAVLGTAARAGRMGLAGIRAAQVANKGKGVASLVGRTAGVASRSSNPLARGASRLLAGPRNAAVKGSGYAKNTKFDRLVNQLRGRSPKSGTFDPNRRAAQFVSYGDVGRRVGGRALLGAGIGSQFLGGPQNADAEQIEDYDEIIEDFDDNSGRPGAPVEMVPEGLDYIEQFLLDSKAETTEEKALADLRRQVADSETESLAEALGLSRDRTSELRGQMRTGQETDSLSKSMLLNDLGFALAGSPRNLNANLRDTTSGILDLDERLRLERRADLEGIYDQRADEIEMGRTGNRSIANIEGQILSDAAIRSRAGDAEAFTERGSINDRLLQADLDTDLAILRAQLTMAGQDSSDPYEQFDKAASIIEMLKREIIAGDDNPTWFSGDKLTDEAQARVDELDNILNQMSQDLFRTSAADAGLPEGMMDEYSGGPG